MARVLLTGAVLEGDLGVLVRAGMSGIGALSPSTSSIGGQAVTTRLGVSGQQKAS